MPRDVEIILLKQLASCLAMPMYVIGPDGDLLFFNESAEAIVGRRWDEWNAISHREWSAQLRPSDLSGDKLPDSERPMFVALDKGVPAHRRMCLHSSDGHRREIEATAIPLVGQRGLLLGALGLFWELDRPQMGEVPEELKRRPGSSHEMELILMRRLARYLSTPIFLQDAEGELLYFNPAAEPVLGIPFRMLASTPRDELYETFRPMGEDGVLIDSDDHPLTIARHRCEPAHRRFFITGLDGVQRKIEATAIPLIGQSGRILGATGFFWEIGKL